MELMAVTPHSENRIAQLIDANLDRAREGLRVLEDWCRFGLKEKEMALSLKDWRQKLGSLHSMIYIDARQVSKDPGKGISHPEQETRVTPENVVLANSSRVQEALRVIEEFTRISDPTLSKAASSIRYSVYEIEKRILTYGAGAKRKQILNNCNVYLITNSQKNLKEILHQGLNSGIKMVQYRCKNNNDKEKLMQAKELALLCKRFNSLFIVNDRVDIAIAIDADGVHLGQDDISPKAARDILGPEKLIGQSTHSFKEIKMAIKDGCDYVGFGPIYSSETKPEINPIGESNLGQATLLTELPLFAIGGINISNAKNVKRIGASRVAVSGAIMNTNDPGLSTKLLIKEFQ